jgi:hypothetical protein
MVKASTARTLAVVLLAAALSVLAVLAAPRAEATPAEPEPVCATWGLRSIVQEWGEAAEGSKVVNAGKVVVTKPEGGGTEFAAFDLDVSAEAETLVSVHYKLSDGAATSAGAVRLFGYADQEANTLTDVPDWKDVAGAEQGNLVLTLPAGSKLGTLGVVYDASNSAGGKVTFTKMTIGDRPVSFTECVEPTPSPSVTTPAPSSSVTTPPATDPAATPSATVPPVAGGPSLPVTGVGLAEIVTGGILLLIAGAVAWLVAPSLRRRKRTTFEA